MKLSRSSSNYGNMGSSRFFKSAMLCALAYALGLLSRDISTARLLMNEDLVGSYIRPSDNGQTPGIIHPQERRSTTSTNTPPASQKLASSPSQAKSSLSSSPAKGSSSSTALNLIPNDQLQLLDYFSDSWLLTKENFLKVPLYQIGIVEDACFAAIGKRAIHPHSKMFVDWTDFMVMHLSKWWGELGILGDWDKTMFDHTVNNILGGYLEKMFDKGNRPIEKSPLHPTIAMIAFAPYHSSRKPRGELLTAHALASTIASLYQVGFGRVIVTCNGDSEQTRVQEAFRLVYLYSTNGKVSNMDRDAILTDQIPIPKKVGNTELAAVKITNTTWFETNWIKYNMPLAAVKGMQLALKGKTETPDEVNRWLGTTHEPSYWKYVYLTEPDTLLHTKQSMWKPIQEGLDSGLSFFPHRLQPLPHEANLPPSANDPSKKHVSSRYQHNYIPNIEPFSNITALDEDMYCCDGGSEWPGRSEEFGNKQRSCGTWWWSCGYQDTKSVAEQSKEQVLENHKRIVPYPMMTIAKGTGVVFGPTEQGRRCFPSRTPCQKST